MTVICAWCKKLIKTVEGPNEVTHGICSECKEAQLKLLEALKK